MRPSTQRNEKTIRRPHPSGSFFLQNFYFNWLITERRQFDQLGKHKFHLKFNILHELQLQVELI